MALHYVSDRHSDIRQILSGHFHESHGYGTLRPYGRDDFLIIYTKSGNGEYQSAGKKLVTGAGDITLFLPNIPQDYRVSDRSGNWELIWAHFHPLPHWQEFLQWPEMLRGLNVLNLTGSTRTHVELRLQDVARWSLGSEQYREQFAMNALEEVLLWCNLQNPGANQGKVREEVREAADFITVHLADSLTTEAIAKAVGLSSSRISHLFREQMGVTLQQFLEEQRIVRAKQLLQLTERQISTISEEVGFQNPFYFSQRFKKHTGKNPKSYRTELSAVAQGED